MPYVLSQVGPYVVEQFGDDDNAEYHVWNPMIIGATRPLFITRSSRELIKFLEGYYKDFTLFMQDVKQNVLAAELKDELLTLGEDNLKL